MKERLAHFPHLIDIKRIPGLDEIALRRGAARVVHRRRRHPSRPRALRRWCASALPALAELEAAVANIRVRDAGTIGGNLCFAEPHSDPATLLTALDARLTLTSAAGTRQLPMASFFTGSAGDRAPPRRDADRRSRCPCRRQYRRRLRALQDPRAPDRGRRRRDLRSTAARSPTPGSSPAASASARNGSRQPKALLRGQRPAAAIGDRRRRRHPRRGRDRPRTRFESEPTTSATSVARSLTAISATGDRRHARDGVGHGGRTPCRAEQR